MAQNGDGQRIEPKFAADPDAGSASPEPVADSPAAADDGEPRGRGRALVFAGAIAATALVAGFVGATLANVLGPSMAVSTAGGAGTAELAELAKSFDAMRTRLDGELGRIDDRLGRLEGGDGPAPYTPPSPQGRADDGAAPRSASAAPSAPETVAAITPPPPRARPEPPQPARPLGAPPSNLGTLPAPNAGPTVVYGPPPARDGGPSRFGALGSDRDVAPRNAPPLPVPGGSSDEAQSIPGWRVVGATDGRAVIDGGFLGTFEVQPGMELPEIGVIDSIYLGSGGWVVATSRGIITSDN